MTTLRLIVTGVRFHPKSDPADGLLGWCAFTLNGRIRLDGVAVRRTREGTIRLSFPERRDAAGRPHPLVRPLDRQARAEIEGQVLEALEAEGALA